MKKQIQRYLAILGSKSGRASLLRPRPSIVSIAIALQRNLKVVGLFEWLFRLQFTYKWILIARGWTHTHTHARAHTDLRDKSTRLV